MASIKTELSTWAPPPIVGHGTPHIHYPHSPWNPDRSTSALASKEAKKMSSNVGSWRERLSIIFASHQDWRWEVPQEGSIAGGSKEMTKVQLVQPILVIDFGKNRRWSSSLRMILSGGGISARSHLLSFWGWGDDADLRDYCVEIVPLKATYAKANFHPI